MSPKTLCMRMHLYFVLAASGDYLPNSGMTASFLRIGMQGLSSPEHLTLDELEYLKSRAKDNGLIIHVSDGANEEVFGDA